MNSSAPRTWIYTNDPSENLEWVTVKDGVSLFNFLSVIFCYDLLTQRRRVFQLPGSIFMHKNFYKKNNSSQSEDSTNDPVHQALVTI